VIFFGSFMSFSYFFRGLSNCLRIRARRAFFASPYPVLPDRYFFSRARV